MMTWRRDCGPFAAPSDEMQRPDEHSLVDPADPVASRFRSLVERIPGVVGYVDLVDPNDPSCSFPLYISPQVEALMGYPREAWMGDDELWLQVLHPDDAARMAREDEQARSTLSPLFAEYRMIARDGRVVWVSEKAAVVVDDATGVSYWQGVMVDITERKRAEEALAASEQQFRTMFDAASIGVMTLDLDGRVLEANPMLEQVCQYPAGALTGRSLAEFLEADDRVWPLVEALCAAQTDRGQIEHRFRRRDGSVIWCRTVMTLVRNADGPTHVVAMLEDISDRKRAEHDLLHRTLHDPLTELPNRLYFYEAVTQAIAAAQGRGELAVLLIDLDRFKEINDTLGHHYGDLLLCEFASALRRHVRAPDTLARLGGDEFALLLHVDGDAAAAASSAVGRIEELLARPYQVEGLPLSIEASIGVACFPGDGEDVDQLLQCADIAMYTAKASGVGHALYEPSRNGHDRRRLSMLGELRRAISEGELVLHYQPKLDLRSKRIDRVEALVRWQHPTEGLVLPGQFIPLAEQTGLIRPLTLYVLEAALRQCRRWLDAGKSIGVAVNVSTRNLNDAGFPADVEERLRACNVPAEHLLLEVTESGIIADPARAEETLRKLSALGVRIALDDFGAGQASLAFLARLPLDQIKIDRSFVTDLATNAGNDVIVRSIIGLGHELGLEVVGEGVETDEVATRLEQYGCDLVQGFRLTPALPADDLDRWLAAEAPAATVVYSPLSQGSSNE
jgi:diguanylate cyclase (GGDEF)-like protein/PAS domain S-box-containing protein